MSTSATAAGTTGLLPFTLRLTRARFAAREGEGLLYGASILASVVCSAIAFTVAGGTWMFHQRSVHPTGLLADLAADATFGFVLVFYVGLAAFACALIIPSLVSLSASGAQLGARGRERRLASLRLLGLSSADITRMALLDAFVQSALGTVVGFLLYLVTLPLWGAVEFQAVPIGPGEMLLPWWLMLAVAGGLVMLSMVASAWGLRQVRISPLGVSRRANKPGVRVWRLVVFVLVAVGCGVGASVVSISEGGALFILAGVVFALIVAVNLLGPWLLQAVARLTARTPIPSTRIAARRVIADPRATWGRVATIGVLAFIGGFLALMPISYDPGSAKSASESTFMEGAQSDFTRGAFITLACGFALTAASLLITQASATIERGEQTRALHRMGAPDGLALKVMWQESFAPLLLSTLVGGLMGAWMALPLSRQTSSAGGLAHDSSGLLPMVGVMAGGLLVAALALAASHPLHRRLLGSQERRND